MIRLKKGLTLLELTIVVIIVGLLLVSFANFWKGVDKDFIKAQTCANQISARLSSIINGALLQKGIYKDGRWIYPAYHWIEFYPTGFQYWISTGSSNILIERKLTTGTNYGGENNCYGINYWVKFGVLSGGIEAPIGIGYEDSLKGKIYCDCNSGNNRFDYVYKLFYCKGSKCKEFYKIKADFRSYGIIGVPCLQFSGGVSCQKWADNEQDAYSGCIYIPCILGH